MEKKKRWQFYLILVVILLTIYNISPTLIYYSKPLKKPVDEKRAAVVTSHIVKRVNNLEKESVEWLKSFCRHIKTKPTAIELQQDSPKLIKITFSDLKEMRRFKRFLPRAGLQIQFVPSQLKLALHSENEVEKSLFVSRQIGVHFDPSQKDQFFKFGYKFS